MVTSRAMFGMSIVGRLCRFFGPSSLFARWRGIESNNHRSNHWGFNDIFGCAIFLGSDLKAQKITTRPPEGDTKTTPLCCCN
jgi:hypothetical protein